MLISFRESRFQKLRTLTSSRRQIRWWMNGSVACRPTGSALPFYFRCALALGAWPTCFFKQRIQTKMWICLSCILDRLQEQPARSKPWETARAVSTWQMSKRIDNIPQLSTMFFDPRILRLLDSQKLAFCARSPGAADVSLDRALPKPIPTKKKKVGRSDGGFSASAQVGGTPKLSLRSTCFETAGFAGV